MQRLIGVFLFLSGENAERLANPAVHGGRKALEVPPHAFSAATNSSTLTPAWRRAPQGEFLMPGDDAALVVPAQNNMTAFLARFVESEFLEYFDCLVA